MELFLGLGSNLGDRFQNLQQAVDGVGAWLSITAVSPVYETIPWGPKPDQPHFLNACLAATTALPPEDVRHAIKTLEQTIGRSQRQGKWGPHEIDIDLLFYGDLVHAVEPLYIPHRQIRQRPFVLKPLADIAPDFVHPVHQMTVADMLAEVNTGGVTRLPRSLTFTPLQSAT